MFLGGRKASQAGAAKSSALDQLLSTEQDIAVQMDAAEREAAALIAAARGDATARDGEAAASLATELAELNGADAAALAELVRAMEEESARLVSRYRSLDDEEIARLSAFVVSDITGLRLEQAR